MRSKVAWGVEVEAEGVEAEAEAGGGCLPAAQAADLGSHQQKSAVVAE